MVVPASLHGGYPRCPPDAIDYNGVHRISVMVSIILPDNFCDIFLMESATEAPKGTSNADVNVP